MKIKLFFIVIAAFAFCNSHAQELNQKREKDLKQVYERQEKISPEVVQEYYKRVHSRVKPIDPNISVEKSVTPTISSKELSMPADMWYPGEWEEVKAILVTWPYNAVDSATKKIYASPVFEGVGDYLNNFGQKVGFGPIFTWPDTTTSASEFPYVFSNLINAIQQGGAQAWINIWNASDSLIIKKYMNDWGMPLTNYKFIVSYGNSFWYRDCGPVCFYHGENDELAMLDYMYYPGRALDDYLPIHLSEQMGIPNYITSIEQEGGNVLVDGAGTLFTSASVYAANADNVGQLKWNGYDPKTINYTSKTPLSKVQVRDSFSYLMNLKYCNVLPDLKYDGGTGHIDLYADMWNENDFVFSRFPKIYNTWVDFKTTSRNIDSILSWTNIHDQNYRSRDIPFPTKDNGGNFLSQTEYHTRYTRTYSNHTFVNNVIIQPIFSKGKGGSVSTDSSALIELKKAYPGYTFYNIDVRSFDGFGGAIHCITKQIPADNPVRILHASLIGDVSEMEGATYPLQVFATNKSGIANVKIYWKEKHATAFNELNMNSNANLANTFNADLPKILKGSNDTIVYYVAATSNNGKTMTVPFTANQGGYFEFYGGSDVAVNKNIIVRNITFGEFYPNPTSDKTQIEITSEKGFNGQIIIMNTVGQQIYTKSIQLPAPAVNFEIQTLSFPSGIYTIIFINSSDGSTVSRKLVVR